ncbi:MAG: type sorting protein [Ferruginibacter sp.]|nr:type sorting protein [Ferruginibacter sp.]
MKKTLLALLLGICFVPTFSQGVTNGTLAASDPTFIRPKPGLAPVNLSTSTVHYDLATIKVTGPGMITFNITSTWDNFVVLYDIGGFFPASSTTNALVANDDFSSGSLNSGFTYNFPAAGDYYLVVCSYDPNVTGAYTVTTTPTVVLPVKLVSFTAAKETGNSNILKWSSEEESDLVSYQVQRGNNDKNLTDLPNGNIVAKNSAAATSYSFVDKSPVTGYNYYRLKIIERSGATSYSLIAVVKNNTTGIANLKAFPNPADDYLQVEAISMLNKKAAVSVINAAGLTLQSGQYSFSNQALLTLDVRKLPAGKYFLKIIAGTDEVAIPFIKK